VAAALDGRSVRVAAPTETTQRIAFLARVESLDVTPGMGPAKVIVNARTGSVVMNRMVTVEDCAVAHGNLSVSISTEPVVSQPAPFSRGGNTVVGERAQIEIRQDKGGLTMVRGANLNDVVKALNAIGATPQDLLSILQAMKSAGALRADLEII
jgi:flagellar P-ring protein precursor FlgI